MFKVDILRKYNKIATGVVPEKWYANRQQENDDEMNVTKPMLLTVFLRKHKDTSKSQ